MNRNFYGSVIVNLSLLNYFLFPRAVFFLYILNLAFLNLVFFLQLNILCLIVQRLLLLFYQIDLVFYQYLLLDRLNILYLNHQTNDSFMTMLIYLIIVNKLFYYQNLNYLYKANLQITLVVFDKIYFLMFHFIYMV